MGQKEDISVCARSLAVARRNPTSCLPPRVAVKEIKEEAAEVEPERKAKVSSPSESGIFWVLSFLTALHIAGGREGNRHKC